jgi:hypothetical protein
VTDLNFSDPIHYLFHLLKPSRGVLVTRSSASDGNYAFIVEYIVASKIATNVLEKKAEIANCFGGEFGVLHVCMYGKVERCSGEIEKKVTRKVM